MSKVAEYYLQFNPPEPFSHQRLITHILDDGWTDGEEKEPKEITEVIDLVVQKTYQENLKEVMRAHKRHQGKLWLTKEAAEYYQTVSWVWRVLYDNQYIKEVRHYGKEFQDRYGVTEMEAINIMNGCNVDYYLNKYYRIEHCIPRNVSRKHIEEELAGYA